MQSEFFLLKKSKSISCQAEVVKDRPSTPIICPRVPGHRRARRLDGPIVIDVERSDSADCLWTFFSDCLLSDEVIEELHAKGCTGFATGVVKSIGSFTGRTYSQFLARGWGGMASSASGVREVQRCNHCGHLRYSLIERPDRVFDRAQWDGSDIFFIWPLPNFICLSEKAAGVFTRLNVTGVDVIPITEFATPTAGGGYSPGRLSHSIPKEKAVKYGRSLRID